jgi:hypothetical protein
MSRKTITLTIPRAALGALLATALGTAGGIAGGDKVRVSVGTPAMAQDVAELTKALARTNDDLQTTRGELASLKSCGERHEATVAAEKPHMLAAVEKLEALGPQVANISFQVDAMCRVTPAANCKR